MSTPSRRDRLRPLELLGISSVIAIFTGAIVLMSTRVAAQALIWAGVAFIVSLVAIAMFVLALKPKQDELNDIEDLDSHR
ncbi:unannotated protein [freshwater metagenome]|jgi:hypothetical protein|uniref:Unannotated protein n=1 Tax=freshwater metagenome TaxID=449393 RepID=A0A6J6D2G5_9ZZZZ|nr:hypothetical protein [Actinomycetota bacterium]